MAERPPAIVTRHAAMTEANLARMFERADEHDIAEGRMAYPRYRLVMVSFAERYQLPIERVTAAFVAMSPNNDYLGNLRSLVSVLEGHRLGLAPDKVAVSCYGHCKLRAFGYIRGSADFLSTVSGRKIRSFYHNILSPDDGRWVTVDGHVVCAWRDKNLTMKQAILRRRSEYDEIEHAIKRLAFGAFMVPCAYQAALWFARKRHANVIYDPQLKLFQARDDIWQTHRKLEEIQPYEVRQ